MFIGEVADLAHVHIVNRAQGYRVKKQKERQR